MTTDQTAAAAEATPEPRTDPPERRPAVLHIRYPETDLTLDQVIAAAERVFPHGAVGVAATTAWCGFVRFEAGTLHASGRLDPAAVFDLRLFDRDVEVRWVQRAGGRGPAVVLSEDAGRLADTGFAGRDAVHAVHTIEQTMLLWGTNADTAGSGWITLHEARIGDLPVPYDGPAPAPATHDLALYLVEYVRAHESGNCHVAAERLYRVAPITKHRMHRRNGDG